MFSETNEYISTVRTPWLEAQAYMSWKSTALPQIRKNTYHQIRRYPDFQDLPRADLMNCSHLLSLFTVGTSMVYNRVGMRPENSIIQFYDAQFPWEVQIGYAPDRDVYVIDNSWFRQMVETAQQKDARFTPPSMYAIPVPIRVTDFFELAGVEEAAHRVFFRLKGDFGGRGIPHTDDFIRYNSFEIERRANVWKLAYVSRYMPEYETALRTTMDNVLAARKAQNASQITAS
jgi:hypothetical protein